jgi:hypothetical protein
MQLLLSRVFAGGLLEADSRIYSSLRHEDQNGVQANSELQLARESI